MPSFDVVSEVDLQELRNAVDQTNREVGNRFDFKGTDARVEQAEHELTVHAAAEFQVDQVRDILQGKMGKRKIDVGCLECGEITEVGTAARQTLVVRHGLDREMAKKVIRLIKDSKLKVQTAIQEEQVRVTGKKRDHLQQIMAILREAKLDLPLQFINFRD